MSKFLVPLGIFVLIAGFLAVGLSLDPREVPSPFIGKPAPPLDLPRLFDPEERITGEDLKGEVWILNVWASWCVACRSEHPLLNEFAAASETTLVGLNYKDAEAEAKQWLSRLGNPYTIIAVDREGDAGIDWGVYGVPETFVIDRKGTVRFKQIGPVDRQVLQQDIIPLVKKLEAES
ncbi:MAG: DsbE family thiol:disulfide interchange protein [Proteobacteria bacterium]|nr:MAG: DsbE family thiol:disulfide interchange protein [Pseudomonadota bacterium]